MFHSVDVNNEQWKYYSDNWWINFLHSFPFSQKSQYSKNLRRQMNEFIRRKSEIFYTRQKMTMVITKLSAKSLCLIVWTSSVNDRISEVGGEIKGENFCLPSDAVRDAESSSLVITALEQPWDAQLISKECRSLVVNRRLKCWWCQPYANIISLGSEGERRRAKKLPNVN